MKKFLLGLIAVCLLSLPVPAGSIDELERQVSSPATETHGDLAFGYGAGSHLTGFWAKKVDSAPAANPTIAFIGCTNSASDLTTYTFSGHSVGATGTDRKTLVMVGVEDSATEVWTTALTVGGDAASPLNGNRTTAALTTVDAWILDNPAGTSEDIVVTASEAATAMTVCVWSITDLTSIIPIEHTFTLGQSGASISMAPKTADFSVSAGMCVADSGTAGFNWTGFTESADANGEFQWSAATFTEDTGEEPKSVTCDTVSDAVNSAGVAVTFGNGTEVRAYLTSCVVSNTALTTYTLANAGVGMPDANRLSVVQFGVEDGATNFNFSSATIGGTSMTEVNETATVGLEEAATYQVVNTAGHIEDVAVTMSEAVTNASACVFAVYNLNSTTATGQTTGANTTAASQAVNINTTAGGVALASCFAHETGLTNTWSGVVAWGTFSNGGAMYSAGLQRPLATTETPRSISCDYSGTTADVAATAVAYQ